MKEADERTLRGVCKKAHSPLEGHLALTYGCNFECVHCYCKGSREARKELTAAEWKRVLREIRKEGCLHLVFSGGEPLLRKDFLEIYAAAKTKGFLVSVFTNGSLLEKEVIDHFVKSPPYSIEITLNGITESTYEAVTGTRGVFPRVIANIERLARKKLPVILKTNCLRQNFHEVAGVKVFTEKILGRAPAGKHRFKYGPMIYPRLNGDTAPCECRLSFSELLKVKRQDPDMWNEYLNGLHKSVPALPRESKFLYHCDSWMNRFVINPYGRLQFCEFSDKFSSDLRRTSFREGFYKVFPGILKEEFVTDSRCRDCDVRALCYRCAARAYRETGNEEAPVAYYCELAHATKEEMIKAARKEKTGK
jgi:radical SAM protein with 4Fe4S-binding SPASM domain